MIDHIRAAVGTNEVLGTAIIRTHGNSGHLAFTNGGMSLYEIDPDDPKRNEELIAKLKSLKNITDHNSRITIYACYTGAGRKGERFAQLLANHTGAEVEVFDEYTLYLLDPFNGTWRTYRPGVEPLPYDKDDPNHRRPLTKDERK